MPMMKWIRIKDQLPPVSQHLLVYSKKWGVHIDYVTSADKLSKGPITHWMKLPSKPRG